MKSIKKTLSLLVVLAMCFTICVSALADSSKMEPQPRSILTLTGSLSSSLAKARGRSNVNEKITVFFDLYTDDGNYITSGSQSGYGTVTAEKGVDIPSGDYEMVATVSNGDDSYTKTIEFSI